MSTPISGFLAVVPGLLLKGTVLLLVAAITCRVLCRSSAATRHLIWSGALGGLLLLPLLSACLPNWNVPWGRTVVLSPGDGWSRVAPLSAEPALQSGAGAPAGYKAETRGQRRRGC
jgi:hypothetical protein